MKKNIIIIIVVIAIFLITTGTAFWYRSSQENKATADSQSSLDSTSDVSNEDSSVSSNGLDTSDLDTLATVPDGVYTNGSESMIFEGNTVDISGMVFNYTLESGYIVLDVDNLTFSDEFIAIYKDENGDDDSLIEEQLSKTKESALDITLQYSEKFDWVTYEEYIFKRTEDYSTGPSGTYENEDNSEITLSFDNGIATYVNGDITETYPYVIYLDGEDTIITFYTLDLYTGDLYNNYCENNYFYYDDENSIDLGFGTFVK